MSIKKSFTLSVTEGFSLIEVLVFVSILSLFLVIAVSVVTISMSQNTLRINTLKANHYNEQLLEWIQIENEIDWETITEKGSSGDGVTYCFTNEVSTWPASGSCSLYELAGVYKRYATLKTTGDPVSQVEVTVTTEWQEAGNTHSTQLHTVFSVWD